MAQYTMSMAGVTLEKINENILGLKKDIDKIKEILEESNLELTEEVKAKITESRKRPIAQFKSQAEIEKKFL